MKEMFTPLSENELERLDEFLIARFDKDGDPGDRDEGIVVVSELDGFFTAIVSGPVAIQPSVWLPEVWGDFEPDFRDENEFEEIFTLLIRFMNEIATALIEQPDAFQPLFLEREVDGRLYTIVDEWCEGYLRGVGLQVDRWEAGGLEMEGLLAPIMTFATEQGWAILDQLDDEQVEQLQKEIPPAVRAIHAYWLERRDETPPLTMPFVHSTPRVGRNDPCPCGSGKKYKQCCLH